MRRMLLSLAWLRASLPSRLLVSGWPDCWFCWHHVTQGRLLDLQILLWVSLVFESYATLLCGDVSLKLWWLRLGFYLEDLVFHASRHETLHWSLFCTLLTVLFLSDWMSLRIVSVVILMRLWSICSSTVPLAKSGLDWIQSLLFLSSPLATAITVRHVLFSFSSDELLCVPRVFCYLLSLLKFSVWCQRNDYRFRSKPPSAVGLIASIKGRLSFNLPLLFKRFRSRRGRRFFQLQWEANDRIGKVVGDSFYFCLS